MKRKVEIYSGDLCESEVANNTKLSSVRIPCEDMYVGNYVHYFEVCPKCLERLRKLIYEKFAVINVYDNRVQNVKWKDREV